MVGDMAGMLNLVNSSARRDEWKERCESVAEDDDEAAATALERPDRWRARSACIFGFVLWL
jgi:hypothetical protein